MSKRFFTFLKFGLPVLFWLFLFRAQIFGPAVMATETFTIFSSVNFFLSNLRLGSVPLWDPSLTVGHSAQVLLPYLGATHPIWLLTFFLTLIGAPFYFSFVATIIFYFLLGVAGFYFLSKAVLRDDEAAYLAFLLFLFSSFNFVLFAQYHPVIITVPGMWFFFFLVRFSQTRQTRDFIGLVFFSIVAVSNYLPFYLLTVFLFVLFFLLVVCPRQMIASAKGLCRYARGHKLIVVFSLGAFCFSLMPGVMAYRAIAKHQIVAPMRGDAEDIFQRGARISEAKFSVDGGLTARMALEDLWSWLDQIEYGNAGFFYVSIFAYLVLLSGILVRADRKIIFFLFLTAGLLILLLGNTAPLHPFLFDHLGYFHFFRNVFFLLTYGVAALILLAGAIFSAFKRTIEGQPRNKRVLATTVVILLHIAVGIFLAKQEAVIRSSYVAVFLSGIFWTVVMVKPKGLSPAVRILSLAVAVVVQPGEVIGRYNQGADLESIFIRQSAVGARLVKPVFAYKRPVVDPTEVLPANNYLHNSWYRMMMRDAAVFDTQDFLAYWTFYLSQKIPADEFRSYWQNKLLVYSGVRVIDERKNNLNRMVEEFRRRPRAAFVSQDWHDNIAADLGGLLSRQAGASEDLLLIDGPRPELTVTKFSVNSIELDANFPQEKFLVYNDSFHPDWQAFVDGKRAPCYRANIAFKGVKLPAGSHHVRLRFHPPGGEALYFAVLANNVIILAILIFLWVFPRRNERNGCV